jgi:hypothetical protein
MAFTQIRTSSWGSRSQVIAKDSYWQVTDDHFEASKNAAYMLQQAPLERCNEQKSKVVAPITANVCDPLQLLNTSIVAEGGLEPPRGLPPTGF